MQKKEKIEKFIETSEGAASLLNAFASIVPFGSVFSELFQFVIPQYREKRLTAYLAILSSKLSTFEEGFIKSKFADESFAGLLEDSFRVAVNTISEEKKEYIANIIVKSITSEDVEYTNQKFLLSLLNEINEIEIVILNQEYLQKPKVDIQKLRDFNNTHKDILSLRRVRSNSPKELKDNSLLFNNYYFELVRLGLLNEYYSSPRVDKSIKENFDEKTGKLKLNSIHLSDLGVIFIDYIGINKDN